MKRVLSLALMIVAFATLGVPAAHAEERTCRGTIRAVTVDNIRVPQGATCTLIGTRAQGSVTVNRNATLNASQVRVNGNIQTVGDNANVRLADSFVGGSVQLVQGARHSVSNTRVLGTVLFDENAGQVSARNNNINGDLQAFQNTGGVEITGNRIDANLQCKENVPAPVGGGNIVQGNKEDQCARL